MTAATPDRAKPVKKLLEDFDTRLKTQKVSAANVTEALKIAETYIAAANLDQPDKYKVPTVEIGAMVNQWVKDKRICNESFKLIGNIHTDIAAIVSGFAQKSNATTEQKANAVTAIKAELGNQMDSILTQVNDPDKEAVKAAIDKNFEKQSTKNAEVKDKPLGGGFTRTVVGVGAIVLAIKSFKAAFRPKEVGVDAKGDPVKEKPGFFKMIGQLALAAGITYVGWQVAKEGKGFKQVASEGMSFVERELMRRGNSQVTFGGRTS